MDLNSKNLSHSTYRSFLGWLCILIALFLPFFGFLGILMFGLSFASLLQELVSMKKQNSIHLRSWFISLLLISPFLYVFSNALISILKH